MEKADTVDIEAILVIGGEGGSITLQGRRDARGTWQFRLATDESALADLIGEELPSQAEAPWVTSWDEALALLDRYPWPRLFPLVIHPEFEDAVVAAVAAHPKGGPDAVRRWRKKIDR